jgi:hypothetical protein
MVIGGRDKCMLGRPETTNESGLAIAAPIIAFAGGKLVEQGADLLSEHLHDIVNSESNVLTVNVRSEYFYHLSRATRDRWTYTPALDCLVIVRGKVGAFDARSLVGSAAKLDPRARFRIIQGQVIDFPVLRALGLADYPELYIEAAFQRDDLETVFRLVPLVIYYRQTSVKAPPDKHLELTVTVGFYAPDGRPLGLLPLRIPDIQVGVDYATEGMAFDNPWLAMPPPPTGRALLKALASRPFADMDATPVNVTVAVEETSTPSQFLVFMSHVLASGKSEAGHATEEQLRTLLRNSGRQSSSEHVRQD